MFEIAQLQDKTTEELLVLIEKQDAELDTFKEKLSIQSDTITYLQEQIALLKHQKFGRKSEKNDAQMELDLFVDGEQPDVQEETAEADETITVAAHERKTKNKSPQGRKPLPAHLQRKRHVHDIEPSEKVCACGCELTCIGEEVTEQLDIIPAKEYVIQHVYPKYACKGCEDTVKQAKAPKQPLPKSIATPGLLAHIIQSKFVDHLPLYRQEAIFRRHGVDLARCTMSVWMIKVSQLLEPLYKRLSDELIQYDVAYADETTLQVLKEPERAPHKGSYMWLFGGGTKERFSIVYHYSPSRSHEVALAMLKDFKGYLHCDGYSGYNALALKIPIKQVGCWDHCRRKFKEAQKVGKKSMLAAMAVSQINKLYRVEREIKEKKLEGDAITAYRIEHAKPVLDKFKDWLAQKSGSVLPKSLIGGAVGYANNQWNKLVRYIDDHRLEISNIRMEHCAKPFALGRKNFLFANSVAGAKAIEVLCSLAQTCKHHQIDVYDYFRYILEHIVHCTTPEELEQLLPFHVKAKLSET